MNTAIDPDSLQRIERAVHDAEKSTAGEIVVVIAPRSAAWSGARAVFAGVCATLAVIALAAFVEPHAGWIALAAPLLFAAAWLVGGLGAIARTLAGPAALEDAVVRAAKVAFVDHGVHATQTRAGVLIYLSLFERRVHVLGDAAVHAVIGDAGWRTWAERVGGAMKLHDVDGLVAVVRDVGAALARSFPRAPNDTNELPDTVRVEPDRRHGTR